MNRATIVLLAVVSISAALIGCGKGDDATTATNQPGGSAATSGGSKMENGAAVVNQPTADVPPGGIVLRPSDPNDPKFKQSPKLGGTGGG